MIISWIRGRHDVSFGHHQSHAAAGYYTAPFNDCNILVIDAIGEWDTISIWEGNKNKLTLSRYNNVTLGNIISILYDI